MSLCFVSLLVFFFHCLAFTRFFAYYYLERKHGPVGLIRHDAIVVGGWVVRSNVTGVFVLVDFLLLHILMQTLKPTAKES